MKWISAITALLISISAQGSNYVPPRYRTHYNMYAFGYGNNGLVPGYTKYSPYAYGYNHNGLIPENVRYNMYAFGYDNNGLIVDYYGPYVPSCTGCGLVIQDCDCQCIDNTRTQSSSQCVQPAKQTRQSRQNPRSEHKNDPLNQIRDYLKQQGIRDYNVSNICRVENTLISAIFTLADEDLVIQYNNRQGIDNLSGRSDSIQKRIEKHLDNSSKYCTKYSGRGFQIYQISATGSDEILLALEQCPKIHTIYALSAGN